MLKDYTKLRLVDCVTDQDVADQIQLRLIQAAPANQAAAQALLAKMDLSAKMAARIRYHLATGLAGDKEGEAGLNIAARIEKILAVVQAQAAGGSSAQAAFTGQVAGMTTNATLRANTAGTAGNSIALAFDGVLDISDEVAAWNSAHPSNQVTLVSGNGLQVPDNATSITLAGGTAGTIAAVQALLDASALSEAIALCLVHGLAGQPAADDFVAELARAVTAANAIA